MVLVENIERIQRGYVFVEQRCELEQYVVNVKENSHCHSYWGFVYFILPIVK